MKISILSTRFLATRLSLASILDQIIELNYLMVVFLVPIWFAYFFPTFNIFELNKIIIFRSLVWALFFFTSVKLIFFPTHAIFARMKRDVGIQIFKKYFIIPVLLIVYLLISLFFSINYQQSFFGSYERLQGVTSYFFYFFWFLLVFINLVKENKSEANLALLNIKIRRILIVASVSAFLVSVYGILQIFNLDFVSLPEPPYLTGRTLSTMGQPNFLASFLLLTIPLSTYLFYSSRHFLIKSLYILITVSQIICLFMTSSRGGLLALALTTGMFIIYLFFASNLKGKAKGLVVAVAVLVGLFGFLIVETVTPGRLHQSFDFKNGSFAVRVNFFQAAANAIIAKPFFGYGLENGSEVFIKYYERDWGAYANVSSNTDRAHNLVLDIMLNTGILGLIMFSFWYYSFFKLALFKIKKTVNRPLVLALTFGALSYLISLLFSFSVVATEVYFWLFFAILAAISFQSENRSESINLISENKNSQKWFKLLLAFIIFCVSIWQITKNTESLIADAYLNNIYVLLGKGDLTQIIISHDYLRKMQINKIQREFSDSFVGDNLSNQLDEIQDPLIKDKVKQKLAEISDNLSDSGYKNILLKAKIASQLENYQTADEYFKLILKLAPNWPLADMERGRDFMRRGDLKNAELAYQQVDINLPDLSSNKINDEHRKLIHNYKYIIYLSLGDAYFASRNYNRAEIFFKAAHKSRPLDYSLLKKIADVYYLRGDLETALKYVSHGAILNPNDYNWQVALAALYFEIGNKDEALAKIEIAIQLAPYKEDLKKIREKYKN
ncbi:MAG: O-antigen ligase family protein [Patescibacteria group bacterium]